jgi:DNA mismatch endonuclease (patch repair protein)
MKNTRQRDTEPEHTLRRVLHRRGLRFRVDQPLPGLRRRADIVFPGTCVAVFVDGCFWHGCPQHGTWPKANAEWWRSKIEANRRRDADTDRHLVQSGWRVVRVWEHEVKADCARAAERVSQAVVEARSASTKRTLHRKSTPELLL